MTNQEKQHQKMTTTPVPRLVVQLGIPTTISMLITSVYNMADTYFVSQLGTSASGAVGVVFSLMAVFQAVGFTLGMGSGSLISRRLGEKNKDAADRSAASAFYLSLAFGVCITALGSVLIRPLMHLLGATDTILPYAVDYGRYIIIGAPIICASFVLNNILRAEGKSALAMIGLCTGGVLNLGFDPLLIFKAGLGTAGAAIATLISQCVSFLLLLSMFLTHRSGISLHPKHIERSVRLYLEIIRCGLPSFCRQGLASISTVLLNRQAAHYGMAEGMARFADAAAARAFGDAAVASMSIVSKVFMFMLCVALGIGQGFMPVAGYNYGAKEYGRVRKAYRFTVLLSFVLMSGLAAVIFALSPQLVSLFRRDDPAVIEIGALAMRLQCVAMPLQTVIVPTNMIHQALGRSWESTLLSACRQGIFFIPLILLLPLATGLLGVQVTQAAADVLTFAVSIPFALRFFRNLAKEEKM
ncbi:MAG: MATE family efflux transporter [Clostridia bacterium]|nr:MATE family efflux transporter [Clostridia bacterium]